MCLCHSCKCLLAYFRSHAYPLTLIWPPSDLKTVQPVEIQAFFLATRTLAVLSPAAKSFKNFPPFSFSSPLQHPILYCWTSQFRISSSSLAVSFLGQPAQVQPAADQQRQVPGRALQLPHGGVGRHFPHPLLLHLLRRESGRQSQPSGPPRAFVPHPPGLHPA